MSNISSNLASSLQHVTHSSQESSGKTEAAPKNSDGSTTVYSDPKTKLSSGRDPIERSEMRKAAVDLIFKPMLEFGSTSRLPKMSFQAFPSLVNWKPSDKMDWKNIAYAPAELLADTAAPAERLTAQVATASLSHLISPDGHIDQNALDKLTAEKHIQWKELK